VAAAVRKHVPLNGLRAILEAVRNRRRRGAARPPRWIIREQGCRGNDQTARNVLMITKVGGGVATHAEL